MKFISLFLLFSAAAFASGPELQLKENFDPTNGSYSRKTSSNLDHSQPLENYLIDDAAHCFRGSYDGVKALVHQMAQKYNQSNGGLGSFTIDSQTVNGELSKLKFSFHMKSGALWTWDNVKKCI